MTDADARRRALAQFDALLELDAEQRQRRFRELEAEDAAAAAALSRLLAADAAAGDWLAQPLARTLPAGTDGDDVGTDTAPLPAGQHLGPYRLLAEIGRGGMGVVYLAERADGAFEQQVAIKLIKRGMDTDAVLARFLRERRILARLQHPNIARLVDGGASDDGRPYLVMDYVRGEPLLDYCDARHLAIPARLALFAQVLTAVAYAHRQLIVHRDLKPGNVLVDGDGRVRLLDFGIAKLLDDSAAAATGTGLRVMTPAYAAPEQLTGAPVSTATDVYALGLLLYELLVGQRADPPATLIAPSAALARTPAATEPAGRRATTPARWLATLRGDLDAIVMKALAETPDARYPGVDALADDLERYRQGRPVRARTPLFGYRARKWLRRYWLPVAATGVLLAILAGAAIFATLTRARTEAALRRAEAVQGFLLDLFEQASPEQRQGEALSVRELVDLGARRAEAALSDDPDTRIELLAVVGALYSSLGEYGRATELRRQRLAQSRQRYGSDDARSVHAQIALAWTLNEQEQFAQARELLTKALAATPTRNDGELRADALRALASTEKFAGNYPQALAAQREAIALLRAGLPDTQLELARALASGGNLEHIAGDIDAAQTSLREGLALLDSLPEPRPTALLSARYDLAMLLGEQAQFEQANALLVANLELARTLYGPDHPRTANQLFQIAQNDRLAGRRIESIAGYRAALAIYERAYGSEHSHVATTLLSLAAALSAGGDHAAAIAALERVDGIYTRTLGGDHLYTAIAASGLADARLKAGQNAGAEADYRKALAKFEAGGHRDHIYAEAARKGLGEALLKQQRPAPALPLLQQAHEHLARAFGAGDFRAVDAAIVLARCHAALGDHSQAQTLLAQTRRAVPADSDRHQALLAKLATAEAELAAPGTEP